MLDRSNLNEYIWLKASVIGSLWAAFEIIAGSFLHNLQIPMSGVLLASSSVFIIISFMIFWKEKGMIWRAGLIAALMKSLSPSAIIIGPMIGIFSEALIVEIIVWLTGRNVIGFMLAGGLAVFSVILQKLFRLIINYGVDIIRIAASMYDFLMKQIHLENIRLSVFFILVSAIFFLAGALTALLAYLNMKTTTMKQGRVASRRIPIAISDKLNIDGGIERTLSAWLIPLHLIIMITCLLLVNSSYIWAALTTSLIYIGIVYYRYRNNMPFIRKPVFWMQFVVIILAASMFWKGFSTGEVFSREGLFIGLKMNLRAFVVISGFVALSTELRNPVVRTLLGCSRLYKALNLAFSALPELISGLPPAGHFLRHFKTSFFNILVYSEDLLHAFIKKVESLPEIIVITGEREEGKTSILKQITKELCLEGFTIRGILSEGLHKEGRRIGFSVMNIKNKQRYPLCSVYNEKGFLKYGKFYFNPDTFEAGNNILSSAPVDQPDIIVIDEVGPLEMNNKGWAPAINKLCADTSIPQIWTVRKKLAKKVFRRWNVKKTWIFDISEKNKEEIKAFIKSSLS